MKLPAGHVAGVGVHKATAYGGFGQQMLEKMGWSKGQGLGKQKDGMKEAIEVKKKEDTLGVGQMQATWQPLPGCAVAAASALYCCQLAPLPKLMC